MYSFRSTSHSNWFCQRSCTKARHHISTTCGCKSRPSRCRPRCTAQEASNHTKRKLQPLTNTRNHFSSLHEACLSGCRGAPTPYILFLAESAEVAPQHNAKGGFTNSVPLVYTHIQVLQEAKAAASILRNRFLSTHTVKKLDKDRV